ncbi:hypothetical protein KIN20_037939 [Parelaphostrongylus tenuis]|uniref:Uncharacterized protein n=1 Tax=Parelaphostrongylus tenuis TaxID=148309 RepID=A0AAD5REH7_PARTN|nr:hypothetical protein KIN20_037939 [Parelaphostrongylus tenuis]
MKDTCLREGSNKVEKWKRWNVIMDLNCLQNVQLRFSKSQLQFNRVEITTDELDSLGHVLYRVFLDCLSTDDTLVFLQIIHSAALQKEHFAVGNTHDPLLNSTPLAHKKQPSSSSQPLAIAIMMYECLPPLKNRLRDVVLSTHMLNLLTLSIDS